MRDEVPPCFLNQPPHPAHHTRARVSCGGATSRDHGARTSNTDTSSDPGPALKLCTRRVSCAIIHIEATATDTATNNTHPLLQSAPMVSDCTAVEQASRCGGLCGGAGSTWQNRAGRFSTGCLASPTHTHFRLPLHPLASRYVRAFRGQEEDLTTTHSAMGVKRTLLGRAHTSLFTHVNTCDH